MVFPSEGQQGFPWCTLWTGMTHTRRPKREEAFSTGQAGRAAELGCMVQVEGPEMLWGILELGFISTYETQSDSGSNVPNRLKNEK